MKNYRIAVVALMVLITQFGYGQVTVDDNLPFGNRFVGFDNSSTIPLPIENRGFDEIDISSNFRTKFAITELPTWNGLNGISEINVQRTTMGLNGETDPAWSMLHLWSGLINIDTRRDWMNVGTSYISNGDVMYTGLLERPWAGGDPRQTDAVIAWGCQIDEGFEDNFRILFLQANPDGTDQGTEMMRITPWGNVGMGSIFNNGQQPQNRLEIHNDNGQPQLRISEAYNSIFTEMETSPAGNLHILPQGGDGPNAVAIGFLPGQLQPTS